MVRVASTGALLAVAFGCGGAAPAPSATVDVPAGPTGTARPVDGAPAAGKGDAPRAAAPEPPRPPRMVQLSTADPTCGLDVEGRVWQWTVGEMERVAPSIKGAKSIACGMVHGCVVGGDGAVWCWGRNDYGALGDGTDRAHHEDAVRALGLSDIAEVGVDYARTCARSTTGDVWCWGDSEFGKAGDGRMPDNVGREKTSAGAPILHGAVALGVGMAHACAVLGDLRLSCWGQNNAGSCTQPLKTRYVSRPKIATGVRATSVSAGESVTCAIDAGGGVSCWGHGQAGVLGPAGPRDESPRDRPVAVPLPGPAAEIAVDNHVCVRLVGGEVYCWGQNDHGQLGDGSTKSRAAPALVKGLGKASRIATGLGQSCALVDGRVSCWGAGMQRPDPSSRPDDALTPIELRLAHP